MEFIILAGLVVLGAFIVLRRRKRPGGRASGIRCMDCRYRGKLLDDGVICGFNNANLYKNPVQIRTCMNYEKEA